MRREVRGMFLCCDETLCLPALWAVRPILLRNCSFCDSLVFSTFIFLIIVGLSLKSSCGNPYPAAYTQWSSLLWSSLPYRCLCACSMLSFWRKFLLLRGSNFPRVLVALCTKSSIMEAVSYSISFCCCCLRTAERCAAVGIRSGSGSAAGLACVLLLKYSSRFGSSFLVPYGLLVSHYYELWRVAFSICVYGVNEVSVTMVAYIMCCLSRIIVLLFRHGGMSDKDLLCLHIRSLVAVHHMAVEPCGLPP